jgi:CitMHS family citrate-Mg2+:H+ or citrate-Ca2+:H+ symporter
MLAFGALAIVGVMLAVILTNRLSPLAAMILIPWRAQCCWGRARACPAGSSRG